MADGLRVAENVVITHYTAAPGRGIILEGKIGGRPLQMVDNPPRTGAKLDGVLELCVTNKERLTGKAADENCHNRFNEYRDAFVGAVVAELKTLIQSSNRVRDVSMCDVTKGALEGLIESARRAKGE